jgi:hypothetical protein
LLGSPRLEKVVHASEDVLASILKEKITYGDTKKHSSFNYTQLLDIKLAKCETLRNPICRTLACY